MDRYATYHLRMWLMSDPTENYCRAHRRDVSGLGGGCGMRTTRDRAVDCGADGARESPRQTDEGTWLLRKGDSYDQRR
jgi:hypothetical protein